MKKVLLAVAVVAMFGLIGCSKKKDCECTEVKYGSLVPRVYTEKAESCSDLNQESGNIFGEDYKAVVCVEK